MSSNRRYLSRHRRLLGFLAIPVAIVLAVGLYWFQPWRLWTNTVVDEPLPDIAGSFSTAVPLSAGPSGVIVTASGARGVAGATAPAGSAPASASAASGSVPAPVGPASAPTTAGSAPASAADTAALLASGTLVTHEHQTSGTAELVRLADGHRVLTLKNLRTSDGPALHVWLTDAPVIDGTAGWKVFDDGAYLDLGDLKGNVGNQVYPIPDDVQLSAYTSVTIWCERFSVSFGAAELLTA